jgi:hypothetical protein
MNAFVYEIPGLPPTMDTLLTSVLSNLHTCELLASTNLLEAYTARLQGRDREPGCFDDSP